MVNWRSQLGLLVLSSAALAFEVNQVRLFSVSQFYHFAFMIICLALLGYGASGSVLAVYPRLWRSNAPVTLAQLSLAQGAAMVLSLAVMSNLPFDPFRLAIEVQQVLLLLLQVVTLAAPFFFCGVAAGLLLEKAGAQSGAVYASNLAGSAAGCLLALILPEWAGGEGTVLISALLAGGVASALFLTSETTQVPAFGGQKRRLVSLLVLIILFLLLGGAEVLPRLRGQPGSAALNVRLSPYKGLSYALQYPGAEIIFQRWNAISRVDVVRSGGIRSLPGLSYRYLQMPPSQDGLLVDGDDLSPILQDDGNLEFAAYLPSWVAYLLRPGAHTLVIEPRGGLELAIARAGGASSLTAVEANPLVVKAAGPAYQAPELRTVVASARSFLREPGDAYDVIVLALAEGFHPVRSGVYSLSEEYRYTLEGFTDLLSRLRPGGILVVHRWEQTPPSETLRSFALASLALERIGQNPAAQMAAFRSYTTGTLLVRNGPFTGDELNVIRSFCASRAFDLSYLPDLHPEETNRYNVLLEPVESRVFALLVESETREQFISSYSYDIRPPTDDWPFFGQFFKFSQIGEVIAGLGKTWQPFGGAGFLILLALLAFSILLSTVLILFPAMRFRHSRGGDKFLRAGKRWLMMSASFYFGALGMGYLLVEVALIQQLILYIGAPAYAMSVVLFALLLFSGVGSRLHHRVPYSWAIWSLVALLAAAAWLLPVAFQATLMAPFYVRWVVAVLMIGLPGFLMGIPFPAGLAWLSGQNEGRSMVAWVWGVNGATSVVAAVLAALLAVAFGLRFVLFVGAACYALAGGVMVLSHRLRLFPASEGHKTHLADVDGV